MSHASLHVDMFLSEKRDVQLLPKDVTSVRICTCVTRQVFGMIDSPGAWWKLVSKRSRKNRNHPNHGFQFRSLLRWWSSTRFCTTRNSQNHEITYMYMKTWTWQRFVSIESTFLCFFRSFFLIYQHIAIYLGYIYIYIYIYINIIYIYMYICLCAKCINIHHCAANDLIFQSFSARCWLAIHS